MTNLKTTIIKVTIAQLFLILFQAYTIAQEHIVELVLNKNASANALEINTSSEFAQTNNDFMNWSELNLNNSDQLQFFNYENGENFEIEFMVENVLENEIQIGFQQQNNSNRYVMSFFNNGSSSIFNIITPSSSSIQYVYTNATILKVVKCSTEISFFRDQQFLYSTQINGLQGDTYKAILKTISANQTNVMLHISELQICSNFSPKGRYSVVKRSVPSEIVMASENELNFYYLQKYYVSENEQIQIKVFNNNHEDVSTSLQSNNNLSPLNKYGSNYRTLNISTLESGDYFLEIKNANKGETYYLKFRK